jgi:Uma2 family endonuclease
MGRPLPKRLGRPATWRDLVDLPDGLVGEVVAGEILVTPRPAAPHMFSSSSIGAVLFDPFGRGIGGPGGWVILDEPWLLFGEDLRIADLAGWRRERLPRLPRQGPLTVRPDWLCEVLSPSTESEDRTAKLALYARAAVGHVWLVNPLGRTLEVYRRADQNWLLVGSHRDDARVRAEPFDAIEIDLSLFWGELEPDPDQE